jgi:hypothetical protein
MRRYAAFVLLILASADSRFASAQDSAPPLSPIARMRLAAAESTAALRSGAGHGRVTYEVAGKVVEQMKFQITFQEDKYAVTARYTLPDKRNKGVTKQTMISDGDLVFATRFSDKLKADGYTTHIWRNGKSVGEHRFLFLPEQIFPYDPTKLQLAGVNLPLVFEKFDVQVVSSDDATAKLTYMLNQKMKSTVVGEAHSGFNVTYASLDDDEGPYHTRTVGWQRKGDVWYVRRFEEKWFARARRVPREDRVRTLEYDGFEPNAEVDDKMFDLTGVEKGWFNERVLHPHTRFPEGKEETEVDQRLLSPTNVLQ